MLSLRKYTGKQLVSYLRQGDFAHAGEQMAIELVMNKFKKVLKRQILDVGCGLGGTAKYIQDQGWGTVTGFDIESESIQYATQRYPSVNFHVADVEHVDKLFTNISFDVVCLFNSFYAFHDQNAALFALNKIAKTAADLVIFDYSVMTPQQNNQMPFKPVIISDCQNLLTAAKWKLNEIINITDKYILWYEELINKLETNKMHVITKFGQDAYTAAYSTYSDIYNALLKERLGGVIIYAEKLS